MREAQQLEELVHAEEPYNNIDGRPQVMFRAELAEGLRAAPDERVARALDAETQHRGDERPCHDVARELCYCRILQGVRVGRPDRVHARKY